MNKLKCKICGFEGMNLVTHLKFKHNTTVSEYKIMSRFQVAVER